LVRSSASVLQSPFFDVAYVRALARHRDDVEVLVLERSGRPFGFLPYHLDQAGVARPLGGRLSDFQGPILPPGSGIDLKPLLQAVGLTAWYFNHLPAGLTPAEPHTWSRAEAQRLDLAEGFEAFCDARRRSGCGFIRQVQRKHRKLQREAGPVRFVFHTDRQVVFDRLLAWKSEQRRRTHSHNVLERPWVRGLLHELCALRDPAFSGVLSALYAGDDLVSAHLGLRSRSILHWWFPAYDPAYARYSPGNLLLLELARSAAEQGVQRLELGPGEEAYKDCFATGSEGLLRGAVETRPLVRMAWSTALGVRTWLRRTGLEAPLHSAKALTRRWRRPG
jgi:CelD/BcsL family acetyltransferase involved in cellulose biosynthesis